MSTLSIGESRMSNVNIKRAVENIRSNTTVYTPIVETIVNGIQAIDASKKNDGSVVVTVIRSTQAEIDESLPKIISIRVVDNGVGFDQKNRDSFDTFYSDYKANEGGKGFGRFTCLKYFGGMDVKSIYFDKEFFCRTFSLGTGYDIIVNENNVDAQKTETGTEVLIRDMKAMASLDSKLETVARNIVEMLLPYFIVPGYICPKISIQEIDGKNPIVLNDYLGSSKAVIREVHSSESRFILKSNNGDKEFSVRVFKIYSPKNKKSKISLVAHRRAVTETAIYKYVPEFEDEFCDENLNGAGSADRNFIVKVYVISDFLDKTVSLERGDFEFQRENDSTFGISQEDIEKKAAEIAKNAVLNEVKSRQEKKVERISDYVTERAPWHKSIIKNLDSSTFPLHCSDAEIEALLQREKFKAEVQIRREVTEILNRESSDETLNAVSEIVGKLSDQSKNDLVHYVAMRRQVLEIFRKSLEIGADGRYSSEKAVHDIIFPTKTDSNNTFYDDHNLWLIDERLNFSSFISSDRAINGGVTDRADILIYSKRIAFRSENETSNPVTIFEFKKPNRDDFANPSSDDDPIQQIIRYTNGIRDGEFKTPKGLKINIGENTPFYGYVVCELSPKVEKWLSREKDFKPMADRKGWFKWVDNINLYIEVLSWEKLLQDSEMRNRIFFHKLGII